LGEKRREEVMLEKKSEEKELEEKELEWEQHKVSSF
jgi:hypothetical protein